MTLENLKEIITKNDEGLRSLGVKTLAVFGSVVKGSAFA